MSKGKPAQLAAVPPPAESKPFAVVGLKQTPKGWVAVSLSIRDGRVEAEEAHCPPQGKQYAAIFLRRALNQKVLFPNGR